MMNCADCERPYGSGGFPDLIIPYWAWKRISPTGDDGGLLCPSCICARLHAEGIKCEGAFMSGPITSVSGPTMSVMRRVENIELAIEGRDNHWSGVRELMKFKPSAPLNNGEVVRVSGVRGVRSGTYIARVPKRVKKRPALRRNGDL